MRSAVFLLLGFLCTVGAGPVLGEGRYSVTVRFVDDPTNTVSVTLESGKTAVRDYEGVVEFEVPSTHDGNTVTKQQAKVGTRMEIEAFSIAAEDRVALTMKVRRAWQTGTTTDTVNGRTFKFPEIRSQGFDISSTLPLNVWIPLGLQRPGQQSEASLRISKK